MKILIMCILLCLTVTHVHANEDIRNRMNIIAIKMAKCQGIIRANGITLKSTGLGGHTLRSTAWILSFIKTEELDKIESETYDKVKKLLEKDTEEVEVYVDVGGSSAKCIAGSINRRETMLRFFDEVGIDHRAGIISNRINKIAIKMAKCQGVIRANGITLKSKGSGGKTLRSTARILSFIKTEELDKIESETYDKVKKLLEKDTEKAYVDVDGSSYNCILGSIRRENAMLRFFDKVGIDHRGGK